VKWYIGVSLPVLILLNIYDFYSTATLMEMGVGEANPYMRWMMGLFGIKSAMLLTKGVFIILLCWASYKACYKQVTKREAGFIISAFLILNVYYGYFMYTRNFQYMLVLN